MELTEEQKREWEKWLKERPEHVREVAEKIVPWKLYKLKGIEHDIGTRYSPFSYDEMEDGTVTLQCRRVGGITSFMGDDIGVFGIKPENLEETEDIMPD